MGKTLYYYTYILPSGKPHMGHAYSSIIADILQDLKLEGYNVLFLTGTMNMVRKYERS